MTQLQTAHTGERPCIEHSCARGVRTRHAKRILFLLAVAAALAACTATPVQDVKRIFQSRGDPQFQTGIRLYRNGSYADATTSLQSALNTGLSDADQVTANKYLAFISCASNRERQCRAYFRRVLELDPSFELDPAEARDPVWGPVFRGLKEKGQP